jgi:hypothetical protein
MRQGRLLKRQSCGTLKPAGVAAVAGFLQDPVEKPPFHEVIVTFRTEPIHTVGYDFSACGQVDIRAAPEVLTCPSGTLTVMPAKAQPDGKNAVATT